MILHKEHNTMKTPKPNSLTLVLVGGTSARQRERHSQTGCFTQFDVTNNY